MSHRLRWTATVVENAIRPTKHGAKNWLFLGNVESGKKCAKRDDNPQQPPPLPSPP